MDETGTLSPQELVDGWFRLRGPAKAPARTVRCTSHLTYMVYVELLSYVIVNSCYSCLLSVNLRNE